MGDIDRSLLNLVDEFVKPGHVVWDVGCNLGLFSFAAAQRAKRHGQIVGLEPDAWLIQLLRRSARIQPESSAPVTVLPCCAGGQVGIRNFYIASRSRASNYLEGVGLSQAGDKSESQSVICLSLDVLALQLPAPDILKIDAEGAELEILQGARELILRKHPIIFCEVSSETSSAVTELLLSYGYALYDGECATHLRKPLSSAPWSTIAIPQTRDSESPSAKA